MSAIPLFPFFLKLTLLSILFPSFHWNYLVKVTDLLFIAKLKDQILIFILL